MSAPTVCLLLLLLLPAPLSLSSPHPAASAVVRELSYRLERKRPSSSVQVAAARSLLLRLLPAHSSTFRFEIIPKGICGQYGCFRISNLDSSDNDGAEILIQGTTAVDISSGLHWYLKYWCGAHISWDKTGGVQLGSIPQAGSLPRVDGQGVKVERPVPWSYYQNVVTSSYSYVWWDWKRWEKEIDWMALQGINLPLAFTGQEAIWNTVFKGFNVSSEDLNDFFGGPAFLAWARMGNLHGWGGPLSQNWLEQQLALQKHILSRMVELGMTPVLPSFSGNVPAVFRKIFPSANITRLGDWNTVDGDPRWCCTYLLDPKDSLFVEVGEAFIKQQIKEYGDITDIYNCDTFNENSPPTNDPTYISLLGAAVFKAMSKGDKDAVWLMQGWLFSSDAGFWKPPQMRALLHSVPTGKMIVLDLFADVKPIWRQSSQFYGVPYVWCMLHNFGGNVEMYGILDTISSGPNDARLSQNSTMVGVGMCMEGIEQNPVVYELMSEMAFRSQKVKMEEWLKNYSLRRYGQAFPQIEAAWSILHHTIYNCSDGIADHNKDYIVEFPDSGPIIQDSSSSNEAPTRKFSMAQKSRFSFKETNSNIPQPHLWYSTEEVIKALKLFLDVGDNLTRSATYRYDLVDLTRQVLSKVANQVYLDVMTAYQEKNAYGVHVHSQKFLGLIEDIDELLASDNNFLLGTWLESAKKLAVNDGERKQYEWNARTQVTMWYDNTKMNQSKLHDYGNATSEIEGKLQGHPLYKVKLHDLTIQVPTLQCCALESTNKFWSGLLKNYYLPRASSYFSYLHKSLQENKEFPLGKWRIGWISYSNSWQAGTEVYPTEAAGDSVAISKALFQKYFG